MAPNQSHSPDEESHPGGASGSQGLEEISFLEIAATLLRHRWAILAFVLLVPLVIGVTTLLTPRTWTASTSFLPQGATSGSSAGLRSLAGEFGFDVGSPDAGQSPEFYVRLVQSREILREVVTDSFQLADRRLFRNRGQVKGTLAELLEIEDETAELREDAVIRWLREDVVSASADEETGIVRVAVRTQWPELSAQIVAKLADLVHEFNLQTRQSQAAAERRFVQERLDSARLELRQSEDALQRFLQANRSFDASPELVFEHDRLQRNVARAQQLYASLAQSFEQARIAEVRNTPVLTFLEPPRQPVRPDRRGLIAKILFGVVAGLIFGLLAALFREYVHRQRVQSSPDLLQLKSLWHDARSDLRRVLRPFRAQRQ